MLPLEKLVVVVNEGLEDLLFSDCFTTAEDLRLAREPRGFNTGTPSIMMGKKERVFRLEDPFTTLDSS